MSKDIPYDLDRTRTGKPGPGAVLDNADTDDALLQLMNHAREQSSLQPLKKHPALLESAIAHSQDMATHNKCDHYTFADHTTWAERMAAAGYPGADLTTTGENVAGGQVSPAQAFSDWMGSPGHAAAIMNPEAKHAGSASALGSGGWTYWTTDFAWGAPDPEPTPDLTDYDYMLAGD